MNDIDQQEISTIHDLFNKSTAIRIPSYQRAYSWWPKHYKQFLEDLVEQNGKNYYLGQLLFEVDGKTFYIIDGQQRLTTSVILFSTISKKLKEINVVTKDTDSLYLSDKFRTIDDDNSIFKKCTQKHIITDAIGVETRSQKRILNAYSYFYENLPDDQHSLELILKSLENALITTFFITDKVKATQVFEYQNNRGKELSPFEIIKAYLMHQIYLNSDTNEDANILIKDIQSNISKIYRNMEAATSYFSEPELVNILCHLHWGINGNITAIKEKISQVDNKLEWISSFFENFEEITDNAKLVILSKNKPEIANLFFVGNEADWKIILISIFCRGESQNTNFSNMLKLLEVLCFKLKLGDYRTDYLPKYSKKYFSGKINFDELYNKVKNVSIKGFKWYWNDKEQFVNIIPTYFNDTNYHYHSSIIKYVLWQYENHIRVINKSGALLDKDLFDDYTIEHITPQNPSNKKHSEEFKKEFLHKAGNLALLTKSQNSKFNNKSFEKKKALFQDTALSSYTEIREHAVWEEEQISLRHKNIVNFISKYFDIDSC